MLCMYNDTLETAVGQARVHSKLSHSHELLYAVYIISHTPAHVKRHLVQLFAIFYGKSEGIPSLCKSLVGEMTGGHGNIDLRFLLYWMLSQIQFHLGGRGLFRRRRNGVVFRHHRDPRGHGSIDFKFFIHSMPCPIYPYSPSSQITAHSVPSG